jgi:hypothetical protein
MASSAGLSRVPTLPKLNREPGDDEQDFGYGVGQINGRNHCRGSHSRRGECVVSLARKAPGLLWHDTDLPTAFEDG